MLIVPLIPSTRNATAKGFIKRSILSRTVRMPVLCKAKSCPEKTAVTERSYGMKP